MHGSTGKPPHEKLQKQEYHCLQQTRPEGLGYTECSLSRKLQTCVPSQSGGVTGSAPSKPRLKDLMDALYHKVADKWKAVGVLLEIPKGTLAGIAEKYQHDPHKCLLEMLETWLERIHPPASWATIIEAVEFLGEEQLGRELRDRHMCVTSSPTPSLTVQQGVYPYV